MIVIDPCIANITVVAINDAGISKPSISAIHGYKGNQN